jgi:glycosyltransferase involved in cell wall biosynthesis
MIERAGSREKARRRALLQADHSDRDRGLQPGGRVQRFGAAGERGIKAPDATLQGEPSGIPAMKPRVAVIDMQPISPTVGGGRMRLLGLYQGLGLPVTYVGTYDWPGEKHLDQMLSPTLREIDVPLSAEHFAAAELSRIQVGGKTVIDAAFHSQAALSPGFVEETRKQASEAEIVVLSHPWCYPQVRDVIDRKRQLLVYDAQNVESYLKFILLDDNGGPGSSIVRALTEIEFQLCHEADVILTCSSEDRDLFAKLYGSGVRKTRVIPNGVFATRIGPSDPAQRRRSRDELGIRQSRSALFLGSHYQPNVDAALFIAHQLAPRLPEVEFLIAGGVSSALQTGTVPANARLFGVVDEATKKRLLHAADLALNPMFEGSGTAVKMFDFMAAALPVVSTPIGVRGIVEKTSEGIVVAPAGDFGAQISLLLVDDRRRNLLGERNRHVVEDRFSWERISANLGRLLLESWREKLSSESLPTPESLHISGGTTSRVALLSTWNIKCGIAEYSLAFAAALRKRRVAVLVLGNSRGSAAEVDSSRGEDVVFAWDYQGEHGRDGKIYVATILEVLQRREIKHVSIQHHPGFYAVTQLSAFVAACKARGISTCVTLHNSKLMPFDDLRKLADDTTLLTLSDDERVRLGNGGVRANYLPLGVDDVHFEPRGDARAQPPVLGTFGFIRAHKGLLPLIQAVGHLANRIPGLSLRMYTALYPSEDSRAYHQRCIELIARLALGSSVALVADFLPLDDLTRKLHDCDLVVLPYGPSEESASAAASTAVSARCPIAVSSSAIFNEIRDVVHTLDSCEPQAMAMELGRLLRDRDRLEQLASAAARYVEQASWDSVASRYIERFVLADHPALHTPGAVEEVPAVGSYTGH